MDVSQSNDNDMCTTASVNYDDNIKQDMDNDMNNMVIIPDNNFENGFENSEIIELNDSTIDGEKEEFVEDDTSTDSIRHIPFKVIQQGYNTKTKMQQQEKET